MFEVIVFAGIIGISSLPIIHLLIKWKRENEAGENPHPLSIDLIDGLI